MQSLFYGVGAAVVGIILRSTVKLGRSTLKKDPLLWGTALVLAVSTAYTGSEIVWLFLLAGVASLAIKSWPWRFRSRSWRSHPLPICSAISAGKHLSVLLFFAKLSFFVFGSGLAIVPFLHGGVVEWSTGSMSGNSWTNCSCNDYSGPGCHHGGFHRLSGGRSDRCILRRSRCLPARLLGDYCAGTCLSSILSQRSHQAFREWSDGGGHWSHRWISRHSRKALYYGRSNRMYRISTAAVVLWRWKVPEPIIVLAQGYWDLFSSSPHRI